MSTVLIAGGAGFLGSQLSYQFKNSGSDVVVFDNNVQYFYPSTKYTLQNMKDRHERLLTDCTLIRGSTDDPNDLRRAIWKYEPNIIINLAALPLAVTAVHNSEEAYKSILAATHNFMEILRDYSLPNKYVHISSSMVYGDFEKIPNPESASKNPKEIYGSMKLASEYLVTGYSKRYDLNSAIIRPSAVYGPGDNNQRVLQKFCEAAINNKKIVAKNAKSNFLDFSFIEDTVSGIKAVAENDTGLYEAFNITRGEGRSLAEALDILKEYFPNLQIEYQEQDNSIYPVRGALDISKAKKMVKYNPTHSLEDGLKKYINYLVNT